MNNFLRLLQLSFLPHSIDAGLLVLRLWIGVMMFTHGWQKLRGFSEMSAKFPDILGIGSTPALALAVFAEAGCSILLALGLFTRFAAATLAITMGVAFFMAHKGALTGPGNGELAFIYLGVFVALLIAGAGRSSLDAKIGQTARR
jgi:putative oxidoreductase